MESLVDDSARQPRSMAWLFASFGALAVLLAAVGAYGVVSWSAARLSRLACVWLSERQGGASSPSCSDKACAWSRSGLRSASPPPWFSPGLLTAFLYNTASSDAFTSAAVSGIMVFVALLAGYIPARRAAGVDPLTALRVE
jgi:hypothetical protein